jgi:glycerophosphoryl diester phosphodiesterase
MEPLLRPPLGFAHRGARADAPDNTLEAFALALRLGAPGLESDVWLTGDGVPVLDHDGVVRRGLRRRPIASLPRAQLPGHIPSLEDLYRTCGDGFHLSLDVKDARAAAPVVAVAREAGGAVPARLWLCHGDWEQVAAWRRLSDDIRLVDSTRLRRIREGPERRAASLADAGVTAINLPASDWTGGLTTLFHRFERLAFAWDAQFDRVLRSLLGMGCDAVYSDHVDRMVAALKQADLRDGPDPDERPANDQ